MTIENNTNIVQGAPTKELFIYMLTRDIPLSRAILDLVDNSVDGAIRVNSDSDSDSDFEGFWIRIECNNEYFSIVDNCGGIPVGIARDYAFRFGRPRNVDLTPGSIGKFGVGMKRSFFKLGKAFKVESETKDSYFVIEHDVNNWLKDPNDWHFKFKEKKENLANKKNRNEGTRIIISQLNPNVSRSFDLENFKKELCEEIESAHSVAMSKGLSITFNGIPLGLNTISLLQSNELRPAYKEKIYKVLNDAQEKVIVKVKIFAGISERNYEKGGWYIFCNGRMVLEADKTENTTWSGRHSTPKYHPDFAFFRGYVFFESDDAELLPWTTTKTGVDLDSEIYRAVQLEMISVMKPIISFLRNLVNERAALEKGDINESDLESSIKDAKSINYVDIEEQKTFSAPKPKPIPSRPKTGRIQYNKPIEEINKVKKKLNVTTYTKVGEKTFDYFMRMEFEE